jgi:hypothetical protein
MSAKNLDDVLDVMTQPRLELVLLHAKVFYSVNKSAGVKLAIMGALRKLQNKERAVLESAISQPNIVDFLVKSFNDEPAASGNKHSLGKVGDSACVDKS